MKATIEFELDEKDLTEEQKKEIMMEHIIETMDDWLKGNAVITIEFETEKNEILEQNNIFIH